LFFVFSNKKKRNDKYPILGVKKIFLILKKVVFLMKSKAHLTPEGLEEIRRIKLGMNKGRKVSVLI